MVFDVFFAKIGKKNENKRGNQNFGIILF